MPNYETFPIGSEMTPRPVHVALAWLVLITGLAMLLLGGYLMVGLLATWLLNLSYDVDQVGVAFILAPPLLLVGYVLAWIGRKLPGAPQRLRLRDDD